MLAAEDHFSYFAFLPNHSVAGVWRLPRSEGWRPIVGSHFYGTSVPRLEHYYLAYFPYMGISSFLYSANLWKSKIRHEWGS